MSDIVFYTNPQSRGRIAHFMLEEVGAPYRVEVLDFEKGEHKKPDYLAINPMGKVPAIVHNGTIITECAAICTYLADAFPKAGLAPALDDPARGTYLRWMFFANGCIEPAMVDKMFNRPEPDRPGAIGYGSYDNVVKTLESLLATGPWILGDKFSAVDVYLGSQIGWAMMTKALAPSPVLGGYAARLTERPAYKRSVEHCDRLAAELKAKKA